MHGGMRACKRGHVLCMNRNSLPHTTLKWTPPIKKQQTTGHLERTVEEDMRTAVKTWMELDWLAQDRADWRFVDTLYLSEKKRGRNESQLKH